MSENIALEDQDQNDLANIPIEGLSRLQTTILASLFNDVVAGIKTTWTLDDLTIAFPGLSTQELVQNLGDLEAGAVITVARSPGAATSGLVVETTPRGFVDYVQHFREDIVERVGTISNAITSTKCKNLHEINQETNISLPVIIQVLRYFEFERWLTLDPDNDYAISRVDKALVETYGS